MSLPPASKSMDYVRVTGPYYIDAQYGPLLIPVQYKNGVLDITNIDNFASYSGAPLMNGDIGLYNLPLYKSMGGSGLVTSLGKQFINYIRRWRSTVTTSPVTNVELYTNGIMTKIQSSQKSNLYSGGVFRVDTKPPSSDFYVIGDESVMYRTTWIFKKPLTIKTIEDGFPKYITFNTTLY
jgi:hypothetical protein